ncbi:MAG: hypothetical protein IK111_09505 [Lachnospiraceae bacterium]|nr:hypothetical protein [Lachnospiraceae bacterium]
MKNELKRRISSILIAAMVLSTIQGNVVAAAPVSLDSEGPVFNDSVSGNEICEIDVRDSDYPERIVSGGKVSVHDLFVTLNDLYLNGDGVVIRSDDRLEYSINADKDAGGNYDVTVQFFQASGAPAEEEPQIASAEVFRNPGSAVTGDVYTLSAGDSPYKELKFTFYDTVMWMHGAEYADGSVSQPGYGGFKTVSGAVVDDIAPTFVINGHKLSEAIDDFPEAVKKGYSIKHWEEKSYDVGAQPVRITLSSNITKPFMLVTAVWEVAPHVHDWEFDKVSANVVWTGNDTDGYTQATIKKRCKNTADHKVAVDGPIEVDVSTNKVTVSHNEASCGERDILSYTAVFDNTVDPAIKEPFSFVKTVSGPVVKHKWKVASVSSNGSYDFKPTEVSMNIVCERDASHKETVSASKITLLNSNTTQKTYKYTGTASDGQEVAYEETFTRNHVHEWRFEGEVVWEGNDDDGYTKASITKTCINNYHNDLIDGPKTVSVSVVPKVSHGTKCGEYEIVYTAVFDSSVDPAITESVTYIRAVLKTKINHIWKVDSVSSNGSFESAPTTASLNIVCERDALHKETVSASKIEMVSSNELKKIYKYTGTASDGQTVKGTEIFNSHKDHDWSLVKYNEIWKFDWTGTTSENSTAKAKFVCSVGGETEDVTVPPGNGIERTKDERKIMYKATISDPAGVKKYSETFVYKIDKNGKLIDPTKPGYGEEIFGGGFTLEGLEEEYLYTGAAIKPSFKVVDNASGLILANGVDYSVSYKDNKKVGTAIVKVKGKGNYSGTNAEATFKIVDPKTDVDEDDVADLKGAKITEVSPAAFVYNGEAQFPASITLKLKNGNAVTYTGTDGKNYVDADGNELPAVVTFSGNVDKGTATVLLSGKQDAKKATKTTTVKKTFKINAVDLSKAGTQDLVVTVDEKVEWAAKGAQPDVKVEYKGKELMAGQDYKVSYKNNKKIQEAQIDLSGKGNYAKVAKAAAKFNIVAFDLSRAEIIATTAAEGVKGSKVKVTIFDRAGNPIPAAKMYVTVKKGDETVTDKLTGGDEVTVEADAKGLELKETCRKDVTVAADLGKAKIKVNGLTKEYTGEEITLTADDMKKVAVSLKINGTMTDLTYNEDFVIAGYSNNVKKGSMTVTIVGKGEKVSGSKTFKVKITAKPIGTSK